MRVLKNKIRKFQLKRIISSLYFTVSVFIVLFLYGLSMGKDNGNIYTTWPGIEVDKCASSWLIKRFVNTEAKFRFVPKGDLIREGIPFDTPQGDLRVSHNNTTFSAILEKYQLNDQALLHMAIAVKTIEIKAWEKPLTEEAKGLESIIYGLSLCEKESVKALKKSHVIFDYLYEYYKKLEK